MKLNYFHCCVIIFRHNPTEPPMHLSHLGTVFTIVMAEIRILHSYCCRIGDLLSVVLLAQKY